MKSHVRTGTILDNYSSKDFVILPSSVIAMMTAKHKIDYETYLMLVSLLNGVSVCTEIEATKPADVTLALKMLDCTSYDAISSIHHVKNPPLEEGAAIFPVKLMSTVAELIWLFSPLQFTVDDFLNFYIPRLTIVDAEISVSDEAISGLRDRLKLIK